MKFLIIDECPTRREFLKSILKPHASEFIESTEASVIQETFSERPPDWAALNLETKGLDCMALLRAITTKHPGARIILLSSFDDPDLKAEGFQAGAFGFVLQDNLLELEILVSCLSSKNSKRSYA